MNPILLRSYAVHCGQHALFVLQSVILARLFGPLVFGVWLLWRLMMTYVGRAGRAVMAGMLIPCYRAITAPRGSRMRAFTDAVNWMELAASGVLLACLIVGTVVVIRSRPRLPAWAWLVIVSLWIAQRTYAFASAPLKTSGTVSRLSRAKLLGGVLTSVAIPLGGVLGGWPGALAGFALGNAAAGVWLLRTRRRARTDGAQAPSGVPRGSWLASTPAMVFADLDQWLIAAWAGLPGLGLYGPAILLGGVVRMWPASHRAVYAAELSRQRDTASWTAWQPQIDAALHLTAYGLPLVAVTLVALADPFIRLAFPAHVQSIAVAKWVILANLWYAVGAVAAVFCQAAQAPQWSWRTTALALAHATLTGWMLTSGRGLPGVAIGLFLTYAVYAVTQVRALCDTLRAPEGAWRKLLGRVSLPILLTVALCAVIETLLPLPATRAGMALVSLDRLVIGAAASGWFWWWTARRWPVARRTA